MENSMLPRLIFSKGKWHEWHIKNNSYMNDSWLLNHLQIIVPLDVFARQQLVTVTGRGAIWRWQSWWHVWTEVASLKLISLRNIGGKFSSINPLNTLLLRSHHKIWKQFHDPIWPEDLLKQLELLGMWLEKTTNRFDDKQWKMGLLEYLINNRKQH